MFRTKHWCALQPQPDRRKQRAVHHTTLCPLLAALLSAVEWLFQRRRRQGQRFVRPRRAGAGERLSGGDPRLPNHASARAFRLPASLIQSALPGPHVGLAGLARLAAALFSKDGWNSARHAHHPSHPPSSSRSFIPATPATFRSDSPTLPKALDFTAASARCPHKNAPRVKQRTSVMSGKFRLHPEPGTERHAPFRLGSAIYNTIRTGGLGSGLLVPHVLLPIYGIYVVTHRSGYWTPEFERGLTFAIALLQGVSFGSAIALSIVRYSASGKAIKGRRIEKTATDSEESSQHRIEVALRASIYLFVATMLWEYLVHSKFSPITDEQARHTSSGFLTATGPLRSNGFA
ncbi:hypothetical protein L1887_48567 [Cichorium endivia]|nr:hypothetical protein L1887_48567 [Cichorium endivia]